jgi:hypothetical protein
VAIGRLPAQTLADAAVLVDKIVAAGAVVAAADKFHVYAVDNTGPLDSASFRASADAMASRLPAGSTTTFADVTDGIAPRGRRCSTGCAASRWRRTTSGTPVPRCGPTKRF